MTARQARALYFPRPHRVYVRHKRPVRLPWRIRSGELMTARYSFAMLWRAWRSPRESET